MKKLLYIAILIFSLNSFTNCRDEKPTSEKVEDVTEDAEDAVEDVAEDLEDAIDQ